MIDQTRLEQFQEILRVVAQAFPGSHPVIGGGALRDSILNRPIKDVDVFIRAQDYDSLDSPQTKFIRPPIIVQRGYGRDDMYGAWDFKEQIAGYDVQLILADFEDKVSLAHSFDLGIARVTYDGHELYISNDFKLDAADKAFRIRRADNRYELERSLKRIERLKAKYPDFEHYITAAEVSASNAPEASFQLFDPTS